MDRGGDDHRLKGEITICILNSEESKSVRETLEQDIQTAAQPLDWRPWCVRKKEEREKEREREGGREARKGNGAACVASDGGGRPRSPSFQLCRRVH